jgi:hypothetical protein
MKYFVIETQKAYLNEELKAEFNIEYHQTREIVGKFENEFDAIKYVDYCNKSLLKFQKLIYDARKIHYDYRNFLKSKINILSSKEVLQLSPADRYQHICNLRKYNKEYYSDNPIPSHLQLFFSSDLVGIYHFNNWYDDYCKNEMIKIYSYTIEILKDEESNFEPDEKPVFEYFIKD